jgi:hypothetical protein
VPASSTGPDCDEKEARLRPNQARWGGDIEPSFPEKTNPSLTKVT